MRGEEVALGNPHEARAHGVGTVFQELTLMPWMTVAENLFFGARAARARRGLIRRRELADRADEVLRAARHRRDRPARARRPRSRSRTAR